MYLDIQEMSFMNKLNDNVKTKSGFHIWSKIPVTNKFITTKVYDINNDQFLFYIERREDFPQTWFVIV